MGLNRSRFRFLTMSFLLLVLSGSFAFIAHAGRAPVQSKDTVFTEIPGDREFSGRMIVRPIQVEAWIENGLSDGEAAARVAEARDIMKGQAVLRRIPQTDEYLIEVPEGETENTVFRSLIATGLFQYVEPDWIVYPVIDPNDPGYALQWHHDPGKMQSADAWNIHTGNPSVSVGICDTGIRTTHEDLKLHRLEGYNAVDMKWESQGGQINPVHPHGTETTGCAAANGNNNLGVAGVGWNLSHRMMRVSNSSSGNSSLATLQHAARTSVENGDKVASVSYSGVDSFSNLTTATYIKSIGGLLVWSAGNAGSNLTFGDRDADDIIVVGATDSADALASFSNFGIFVDLTAPGVSVYTTDADSDNDYAFVNGTSFSCPLTAGLAALIWSNNPALTPDDVESMIKQGCDDLGAGGIDNTFGYGRINTYQSLAGGPLPSIKANGADGSLTIPFGTNLTITFSLDPGTSLGANADWWLLAFMPFPPPIDLWYFDFGLFSYVPGFNFSLQNFLFPLPEIPLFTGDFLPAGTYYFFFIVDLNMNGVLDLPLYLDFVEVNII